jgi:hypothetical protein
MKPHPMVAETWACFEALRRAGFASDDIYVIGDAGENGEVVVQLRAQGKEFNVVLGPSGMPVEEFHAKWTQFCADVQTISEVELQEMWDSSHARRNVVQLVASLKVRGFRLAGDALLN